MTDIDTRLQHVAAFEDGGAPPPVEELVRRIHRRRHRRAGAFGAGAAALSLVAALGVALGGSDTHVRTADEPTTTTSAPTSTTAIPPATLPAPTRTTTTTAGAGLACRNSYDPACGPFRWDPAPKPQQMTQHYTVTPEKPKAGETVTVRVVLDDPDAVLEDASVRFFFESSTVFTEPMSAGCPTYRTRYGPWTPPAKRHGHIELTFTHVYSQPGSYTWGYTAFSARCEQWGEGVPRGESYDGGYNPYGSYTSEIQQIEVLPADEGTTTTTAP